MFDVCACCALRGKHYEIFDWCANCERSLCPSCMQLGCCDRLPALSGQVAFKLYRRRALRRIGPAQPA